MPVLATCLAAVLSADPRPCAAEAAETVAFTSALAAHVAQPGTMLPLDLKLVDGASLPALPSDPVQTLVVTRHETLVNGTPHAAGASVADLHRTLRASLDTYLELHRAAGDKKMKTPVRVNLAVDATATWRRVVIAAQAAEKAGLTDLALIFAAPDNPTLRRPASSSIDADLRVTDDSPPRGIVIEQLSGKLFGGCRGAVEVFSPAGGYAETELKRGGGPSAPSVDQLLARLAPALGTCPCNTDFTAIRALLWDGFYLSPPQRALRVKLSAKGTAVSADPTEPWSAAAPKLLALEPGAPVKPISTPKQ